MYRLTMSDIETEFGSYLVSVQERDIDLLLMEEFHADPAFVTWFSGMCGLEDTSFMGAWHSVTGANGETDLLVLVRANDRRVAILIENKVAAAEQPSQDQRYLQRGAAICHALQAWREKTLNTLSYLRSGFRLLICGFPVRFRGGSPLFPEKNGDSRSPLPS